MGAGMGILAVHSGASHLALSQVAGREPNWWRRTCMSLERMRPAGRRPAGGVASPCSSATTLAPPGARMR